MDDPQHPNVFRTPTECSSRIPCQRAPMRGRPSSPAIILRVLPTPPPSHRAAGVSVVVRGCRRLMVCASWIGSRPAAIGIHWFVASSRTDHGPLESRKVPCYPHVPSGSALFEPGARASVAQLDRATAYEAVG